MMCEPGQHDFDQAYSDTGRERTMYVCIKCGAVLMAYVVRRVWGQPSLAADLAPAQLVREPEK